MSRINTKSLDLVRAISEFITDYAPMHLTNSQNTLHSYETAITLYIGYLETECGIKPTNFSPQCFEQIKIEGWMEWLSNERGCSPQTCNTRLSSFRKFIRYLSSRNPNPIRTSSALSSICSLSSVISSPYTNLDARQAYEGLFHVGSPRAFDSSLISALYSFASLSGLFTSSSETARSPGR